MPPLSILKKVALGALLVGGTYVSVRIVRKRIRLKKCLKDSGNNVSVQQAQALYGAMDRLGHWMLLPSWTDEDQMLKIAKEIYCWEGVKQAYTNCLNRNLEEDLRKSLSSQEYTDFTTEVTRNNKHLQCTSDNNVNPNARAIVKFPAGQQVSTAVSGTRLRATPEWKDDTPGLYLTNIIAVANKPGIFLGRSTGMETYWPGNTLKDPIYFTQVEMPLTNGKTVKFWVANSNLKNWTTGEKEADPALVADILDGIDYWRF